MSLISSTNIIPMPRFGEDHLAHVYAMLPLEVVDAKGVYLNTRDGRRILDMYGGHAVAALGYGHPRWVEALTKQAGSLLFQTNVVSVDVRRRAATKLANFCGLGLDTIFFVNSGAEANENAMKIALRMTGANKIVAIEGSFHGRTAAAGAVTWGAQKKWYGFARTPFEVEFIPRDNVEAIEKAVTDTTAAVIVEPIQGVGGAIDMSKAFLQALRHRCTEMGSLLIFDEVQCGVGRTGFPFAANMYDVTPDMITTAKALGAGFPVSAVLLADHVAQELKMDDLGTTFGGGPMACAVVEAVIEIIESERLMDNVQKRSAQIRKTCVVGPVTGTQGAGLLLGLKTSRPAKDVHAELLKRGILTGTSGDPNVLRILAPFTIESEHVEMLRDALMQISA
ncbi:MAG TPA: aminotransferase class III-fold pyridoxal phosphate-dependent enzyme [Steroidobacteraceae bacterium]|nr:aminotransferase class III-fold pyridoxal phosphate-dependent enzyme [Steroidobacteraceae bacterium]